MGGLNGSIEESQKYGEKSKLIRNAANLTFSESASCKTGIPSPRVSTCIDEWEADTKKHFHNSTGQAYLNCGKGSVISRVVFADYGLASGSCSVGFTPNASCTSSNARGVVERACLRKEFCFLKAADAQFGDGCRG